VDAVGNPPASGILMSNYSIMRRSNPSPNSSRVVSGSESFSSYNIEHASPTLKLAAAIMIISDTMCTIKPDDVSFLFDFMYFGNYLN